jgi:hypothetical protein
MAASVNATERPDYSLTTTTTNKVAIDSLNFDGTTAEYAMWRISMPIEWDEGTLKVKVFWRGATGCSNADGVAWDIDAVCIRNDDLSDTAFGTKVTVTDTIINTTADLQITSASSAMTVAGTIAEDAEIYIRIKRDPANGSDTMTEDAQLSGIKVQYLESSTENTAW